MTLRLLLPKVAPTAFAAILLLGSAQLYAETGKVAGPAGVADLKADTASLLPQPGPWLLAACAVAVGAANVRWRGKRHA